MQVIRGRWINKNGPQLQVWGPLYRLLLG